MLSQTLLITVKNKSIDFLVKEYGHILMNRIEYQCKKWAIDSSNTKTFELHITKLNLIL